MIWLLVALSGYFLLALVSSVDKFLLSGKIKNPRAYAFYMGLLGMLAFVAAPFGFSVPDFKVILIAIFSGFIFIWALVIFYKALLEGEASRVVPVVGGLVPIFVLILSRLFLNEGLSELQLFGIGFLILGGGVLSLTKKGSQEKSIGDNRYLKNVYLAILAALFFAFSAVAIKYAYDATGFINGFLWARIGGLVFAGVLILSPMWRRSILTAPARAGVKTDTLYIVNIILGAAASILIQYAIALGSVSLVTAAQGAEYAFLFLILAAFSKKYPLIFKEHLKGQRLRQKTFGLILVALGLIFLAVS